jgi:hypothetical protein
MPDDNRFEGLGEALGEDESADDERETTAEYASRDTQTEQTDDDPGGPAFPFDATEPTTLYAREESWNRLDDAFFEARAALRERDVRDVETRELHDALLRAADPETIADAVESARND